MVIFILEFNSGVKADNELERLNSKKSFNNFDKVSESISHLINYHWTNSLPIISSDSALLLRTPLIRTTDLRN